MGDGVGLGGAELLVGWGLWAGPKGWAWLWVQVGGAMGVGVAGGRGHGLGGAMG